MARILNDIATLCYYLFYFIYLLFYLLIYYLFQSTVVSIDRGENDEL